MLFFTYCMRMWVRVCVCVCVYSVFFLNMTSQRRVILKVKRKEIPWFFALWIRTVNSQWLNSSNSGSISSNWWHNVDLILSLSIFCWCCCCCVQCPIYHMPSFQFDCSWTAQKTQSFQFILKLESIQNLLECLKTMARGDEVQKRRIKWKYK